MNNKYTLFKKYNFSEIKIKKLEGKILLNLKNNILKIIRSGV